MFNLSPSQYLRLVAVSLRKHRPQFNIQLAFSRYFFNFQVIRGIENVVVKRLFGSVSISSLSLRMDLRDTMLGVDGNLTTGKSLVDLLYY